MLPILRQSVKGILKKTPFEPSRAVSSLSSGIEQYVIREVLPTEYLSVTKLRAPEFNLDVRASTNESEKAALFDSDFNNLAQSCQEADFFCFVAVPEVKVEKSSKYNEDVVHGAVDLLLRVDPAEAHYGLVPPMWMDAEPNKQGCITNLAVAPEMRRRGVARNLLSYALEKAKEEGMVQVFASVDKRNQGVVDLNRRVGFQLLVDDDNARDLIMGIKL